MGQGFEPSLAGSRFSADHYCPTAWGNPGAWGGRPGGQGLTGQTQQCSCLTARGITRSSFAAKQIYDWVDFKKSQERVS